MADNKRLFVKPRYPVHIFGARQGEWPEIGPEWTEVTRDQLTALEAGARECAVELRVMEVGGAQELLEQLQEHGELPPDAPQATTEVVRAAAPAKNASTEEWRHYAETVRGLPVFEGAKREEIQAIVAQADEPQNKEA